MNRTPALELRDVSYSASGKTILHTVNWTVQPGEHWAILGPNGSGKTTLLKLACGYLWPNAGGVVLRKGKELTYLPELRKSIGWVTAALVNEIPTRENALSDTTMEPVALAEQSELVETLRQGMETVLTAHQRRVLVALAIDGVPIDVLADRLGTTRGALYKTLHDARRKLRMHLEASGLAPSAMLEETD